MLSLETQIRLKKLGVSEKDIIEALRDLFPNGHEDYILQCVAEMELHSQKNHDYASGGDSLGNFKRVAAVLGQYKGLNLSDPRVVALVYAMKQIDAVLWSLAQNITAKVEGIVSRLDDVAVYAKIVKCLTMEMARNKAIDEQFGVDLFTGKDNQAGCAGPSPTEPVYVSNSHGRESESEYRRRMEFDKVPNTDRWSD